MSKNMQEIIKLLILTKREFFYNSKKKIDV